jgi:hypothetical protein
MTTIINIIKVWANRLPGRKLKRVRLYGTAWNNLNEGKKKDSTEYRYTKDSNPKNIRRLKKIHS